DLTVHEQRMAAATTHDFSNATELADYLAQKASFRQAHAIVGELVLKGIKTGTALQEMPLSELQEAAPQIQEDVYAELTSKTAVNRRTSLGGTAVSNVLKEVARDEKIIADHENAAPSM
ncbi:argininosuccinate lyase, partial [Lacticaseibacillus rhamnosus]